MSGHVCDVSSVVYKDTKKVKENGGARGQPGFCPNLSTSPPLSVSPLLFFCSTVLLGCHCTKPTMLQINVCCALTGAGLTCEGTSLPTV